MGWQISKFVIALLVIGLFASGLGIFLSHGTSAYNVQGYDNASIANYQKLDELNSQALEVNDAANTIQQQENAVDVIGFYFVGGYNALRIGLQSFNTFNPIAANASNNLYLGPFGDVIKTFIIALVLVILILGVVFKILFKVET